MNTIHPSVLVNNELYYPIADAALCLGVSDKTLRRDMNRRRIRFFHHPSKGYLFLPAWLDEWIELKTTAPKKRI